MPDVLTIVEKRLIAKAVRAGRVEKVPTGASAFATDYVWTGSKLEVSDGVKGGWRGLSRAGCFGPARKGPSAETVDRAKEIRALTAQGMTAKKIAEVLGVSVSRIYQIAKKFQITLFVSTAVSDLAAWRTDEMVRLMAKGKATEEIMEILGVSRKTLERYRTAARKAGRL